MKVIAPLDGQVNPYRSVEEATGCYPFGAGHAHYIDCLLLTLHEPYLPENIATPFRLVSADSNEKTFL